jgi:hypothetical protein
VLSIAILIFVRSKSDYQVSKIPPRKGAPRKGVRQQLPHDHLQELGGKLVELTYGGWSDVYLFGKGDLELSST